MAYEWMSINELRQRVWIDPSNAQAQAEFVKRSLDEDVAEEDVVSIQAVSRDAYQEGVDDERYRNSVRLNEVKELAKKIEALAQ